MPESTFWRVCDEAGVCHCDWRYTIYGCEEETIAKILYTITAIITGLLATIAVGVLYFRLNYRSQKIFEIRNGFPRPKPIESMGLFGIIFNVCKPLNNSRHEHFPPFIHQMVFYSTNDSCHPHANGYNSKSCLSFMYVCILMWSHKDKIHKLSLVFISFR